MSPDELGPYLGLARQLAASRAETTFLRVCTTPGWSLDDIEEATAGVLADMEQSMRGTLALQAQDPEGAAWRELWTAMEAAFRERIAELAAAGGPQPQGAPQ